MALYRLEAKIIGRTAKDKAGKPIPGKQISVVSKAAYRSGEKIRDERTDRTYNYKARSQEVVHAEICAPEAAPRWMTTDRSKLWNTIESCEKRKDSQLAREFVIALPVELDREAQIEAVRQWCEAEVCSKGFVADFAIHRSRNGKNPHAHILTTLRPVEGESFGKKPSTAGLWNGRGAVGKGTKSELENWRESWEKHANAALEKAGRAERVDHRSLKDRGIERLPQPKLGPDVTALERKGVATERAKFLRWTKIDSLLAPIKRTIEQTNWRRPFGMKPPVKAPVRSPAKASVESPALVPAGGGGDVVAPSSIQKARPAAAAAAAAAPKKSTALGIGLGTASSWWQRARRVIWTGQEQAREINRDGGASEIAAASELPTAGNNSAGGNWGKQTAQNWQQYVAARRPPNPERDPDRERT